MTTIQNSAVGRTTAASHSGLYAMVSMTAGTTVMSKAVVGGAAGELGGSKKTLSVRCHLGDESAFPMSLLFVSFALEKHHLLIFLVTRYIFIAFYQIMEGVYIILNEIPSQRRLLLGKMLRY